jgi:hypothetical protein
MAKLRQTEAKAKSDKAIAQEYLERFKVLHHSWEESDVHRAKEFGDLLNEARQALKDEGVFTNLVFNVLGTWTDRAPSTLRAYMQVVRHWAQDRTRPRVQGPPQLPRSPHCPGQAEPPGEG